MPQIVLKLPNTKINEMKKFYHSYLKSSPPGAIFAAKTANSSITAYKSGKVLFQGKAPELDAKRWGSETNVVTKKTGTSKPAHGYAPADSLFSSSHIGSDEAGTGDYFGPITVAAAFVTREQIGELKSIGVTDSKNLNDPTIKSLAKKIVALNIPYSLAVLHNQKYNRLQQKGWTQGKMKTILHHHAISKVLEKIAPMEPEGILIDQFSEPPSFIRHLQSEKRELQKNVYFMTKAESHSIAVATASIIARASFVKEMDKLSEQMGITIPKGASQKVDQVAGSILRKNGLTALDKCAKVHFANTKKAEKYQ
ncbi:ribonuclease HIII [Aquibacillus sp. 3ASR75-11]|uniref:Ribonuclease HIII n=1 Tax=Terrihalobacillus insolitus TaxID=2950438 RepID=A0A9X3WSB6_9BACI|nr:ribonuclease HIII [Terrihalobacillus insolitus]MDC3412592.1 ribonuclease HIII [Terrihalobacillus insolitus]MDC3423943.1 ribonuclease HIII [Terrihalobacillus insolitus]